MSAGASVRANASCDPIADAVADERRKTVAYLKKLVHAADAWFDAHPMGRDTSNDARRAERAMIADAIERWEHLK